jgi:hypothetical protein
MEMSSGRRADALASLLELRRDEERRAEGAVAEAAKLRAQAEVEAARLAEDAERARAALADRRREEAPAGECAADALGRLRFFERLAAAAAERAAALERFRRDVLDPARRAEDDARAAHLGARQRREVVERALERRAAAAKLERERRAEAAADDRPARAGARRDP